MSHLLTRLVDRTFGIVPTIEPVRSPVFNEITPRKEGAVEQHDAGFSYGELFRNPHQTPVAPNDWDDRQRHDQDSKEEGATTTKPIQPLTHGDTQLETSSVQNRYVSSEPETAHHAQDNISPNISVNTDTPITHKQTVVEHETHTSELSPAAPQLHQSSESLSTDSLQTNPTANINPAYPFNDDRKTMRSIPPDEHRKSSEPVATTINSSTLHPRVDHSSSFLKQQVLSHETPREREHSHTAPTIRVTIGRIDVRAVSTPQTTTIQKPRKRLHSSLSLDDYLKQRNRGQR